jgi:hypothetical protein
MGRQLVSILPPPSATILPRLHERDLSSRTLDLNTTRSNSWTPETRTDGRIIVLPFL